MAAGPGGVATTIIVTGGNSGLGFEAAREFARRGARVVLACRDPRKGEDAARRIGAESGPGTAEPFELDLARLASVRAFADRIRKRFPRVDVLVNNAGVMAVPRRLTTVDGFELQFGVNHLGHFALTGLLLGTLTAAHGRVVTVSSLGHLLSRPDPAAPAPRYRKWAAYSGSKLANLLFAYELDRRVRARGLDVASVACHPGVARTNLLNTGPRLAGGRPAWWVHLGHLLAPPASAGARSIVHAALAAGVSGGHCVGPSGFLQVGGEPGVVRTSRHSRDAGPARRLWQASEELTGVRFPL